MNKPLKILGYILLIIVAIFFLFFAYYYLSKTIPEKTARKKVGPAAEVLTIEGYPFRDLNKNGKLDIYEDSRQSIDDRVEDLLSQMHLEEKAGMMFHNFVLMKPDGGLANPVDPMNLLPTHVALFGKKMNHFNLFFAENVEATARWCNSMQELAERTRLGIPITFSTDPRHTTMKNGAAIGFYTEGISHWCEPIGHAAIGDSLFTAEFGRIAAQEYRAMGVHTALHPMADLATEPRWGRISGTFGEDAALSARLTSAYILGFQGDSITPASVSTMTKHFPGGGPQKKGEDSHFRYGKDQVYPGNNFDYHLIPFIAAIKAGTSQMMPYYSVPNDIGLEEVAFGFNRDVITGLLYDSLGYEGIVCTDWGLLSSIELFGYSFMDARDYGVEKLSLLEKIKKALDAGVDQFGGEHIPEQLVKLVEKDMVQESRLDHSVRKLLKLKFQLGLFEFPYVDEQEVSAICGQREFVQKGYESQIRSQVLLTNKEINGKNFLPVKEGTTIYVEDIDPAVAGKYGHVTDDLERADIAILKLQAPYEPREGLMESFFHQGRLHFKKNELKPILETMEQKPTVVVMYMERPPVFPEIVENAAAIVANFGATDQAILDVLFGRERPSGKLPFEIPSTVEAVENQLEDVPYDSENPLFPFGFGLEY